MSAHETVELDDRAAWRRWLRENHASSPGVWLVTWKKSAGKPRVDYDAAVEEALCFGWVDSKSRSIDDARTSLFFTPRKPTSSWSESNVARVEKLEAGRLMRAAGRRAVEEARRNGRWPALTKCSESDPSGLNRTETCIPCYPDVTDDNGSSREMQLLVPPSVVSSSVISNRI